jgi:septal ring factor EnvC (AmiA/AmiB activator)
MIAIRLVLFSCLFTLLVVSSGANEFARSRAELDNLQGRILSVRKQLQQDRSEADAVTGELDGIEQRLSSLHASIRQRQQQKVTLERKILQLNKVASDLESGNKEAMGRLAGLLRSSYILGRQSGLRLLINQQDPQVSVRQLTLFRYVMEARYQQLQDLLLLQQSVRENQQAISQQQHAMDETIAALNRDGDQLERQEAARAKQLSRIMQQVKDSKQTMLLYQQREQWLKKLLLELARPKDPLQAVNKPVTNTTKKAKKENRQTQAVQRGSTSSASQTIDTTELAGFGNNRGALPLPIKAGIRARFGQKKPESGLIWEGVLFNSRQGQPVMAVYPGQVVFSDWFRGYGQLMVLDHGGGYMSLYGYNQSLQAGLGDTVKSGQVIAMAGEAGELLAPGLYFEIRHNGLPDDPLQWCRR